MTATTKPQCSFKIVYVYAMLWLYIKRALTPKLLDAFAKVILNLNISCSLVKVSADLDSGQWKN